MTFIKQIIFICLTIKQLIYSFSDPNWNFVKDFKIIKGRGRFY